MNTNENNYDTDSHIKKKIYKIFQLTLTSTKTIHNFNRKT